MSDKAETRRIAQQYIESINGNDSDAIPLADDVEFRGPMVPVPLHGASAVRAHLAETAPFMTVEPRDLVVENDSVAILADTVAVNGKRMPGALFLRIGDDGIRRIESLFDSHRLYTGHN